MIASILSLFAQIAQLPPATVRPQSNPQFTLGLKHIAEHNDKIAVRPDLGPSSLDEYRVLLVLSQAERAIQLSVIDTIAAIGDRIQPDWRRTYIPDDQRRSKMRDVPHSDIDKAPFKVLNRSDRAGGLTRSPGGNADARSSNKERQSGEDYRRLGSLKVRDRDPVAAGNCVDCCPLCTKVRLFLSLGLAASALTVLGYTVMMLGLNDLGVLRRWEHNVLAGSIITSVGLLALIETLRLIHGA